MWTLLAPIIFQAVKAAELSIKGKRKGKQKRNFVKAITGTAFRFLLGLGEIKTMPLEDEVGARIELALSTLKNQNSPYLAPFPSDDSGLQLTQDADRTVTLTTRELIQVIAAASGRSYP